MNVRFTIKITTPEGWSYISANKFDHVKEAQKWVDEMKNAMHLPGFTYPQGTKFDIMMEEDNREDRMLEKAINYIKCYWGKSTTEYWLSGFTGNTQELVARELIKWNDLAVCNEDRVPKDLIDWAAEQVTEG